MNFPCNYYKYIRGLHTAGIAVNGFVDERQSAGRKRPGWKYVCTRGVQPETSVELLEETGSSAYLSLFDDLDYEQNNKLLSSTQIEIDDNLNVTDQEFPCFNHP